MTLSITARDIVALVILVGSFALIALGYNHILLYTILGVGLAYGAIQIPRPRSNDK